MGCGTSVRPLIVTPCSCLRGSIAVRLAVKHLTCIVLAMPCMLPVKQSTSYLVGFHSRSRARNVHIELSALGSIRASRPAALLAVVPEQVAFQRSMSGTFQGRASESSRICKTRAMKEFCLKAGQARFRSRHWCRLHGLLTRGHASFGLCIHDAWLCSRVSRPWYKSPQAYACKRLSLVSDKLSALLGHEIKMITQSQLNLVPKCLPVLH